MKNSYQWFVPFLMGLLITGAVWFLTDPGTYIYYPRGSFADKLYILLTIIVATYFMYVIYWAAIRYFTNKKNKIKIGIEYTIILFFAIFWNTLSYLFITYLIESGKFSAITWIRSSGLSIAVYFIFYMVMRNNWVTEEYNRQTLQLEKTRSNQLETELKYLRAQYHPHFLFNALNTIYFRIDEQNTDAKNTVELLSKLLRYQLYNMEEKVAISQEINFIQTYIQFQQLRMTKRLEINTYFDDALNQQKIYPLIYQPFLENAFKYVGGEYWINLQLAFYDGQILFSLENSLPEQLPESKKTTFGIGIENIKRRLALLYPDQHQLNIRQGERTFIVELVLPKSSPSG
jgi:sensor histidine kinase YesM